jgi:Tol biopolymer transport system component/DNA-binding winged helix-turn-helix (wHTH) protein
LSVNYSIGEWLIEPALNTASRGKKVVHLEPKVMQVLVQLAMHPGEVLSKEQLIETVWPDTFVSEQALTRCISILRHKMQDNPQSPRYIQTISKSGYRLVAEVRPVEVESAVKTGGAHPDSDGNAQHAESGAEMTPVGPAPAFDRPSWRFRIRWAVLAFVGIAAGAGGFLLWRGRQGGDLRSFRVVSLTSYAGQQDQGAFSPAGNSVAFVWTSPDNGNRNIFVKHIGDETTLRLTNTPDSEYSPTWSPDGTHIAFLASSDKGLGMFEVSSFGGPVRKLYTPQGILHWEQRALSWSPDGKSIAFPDGRSTRSPSAIYIESLDTLQARSITSPPAEWDGDTAPVFSPDGKRIAFIRASDNAVRDIYVILASGGKPRQITHDARIVDSLCWGPDDDSIIFSSNRGGKFALWRVSLRGGEPERLPVGTEDAFQPDFSRTAHRLLYTQSSATWSILAIPLRAELQAGKPTPVVSSTAQDSAPSFAPDGTRLAFQSWRSGTQELWVVSRDGSNMRQLTSNGGLTGSPSFSPDGMWIAFDSRIEGHSHIFIVPAAGGSPRRITTGDSNNILPRWSADGKSLYFASNRNGSWQIWKTPIGAGRAQQVTKNGGYVALESHDGRWVYFTKGDVSGIWRIPVAGGAEEYVFSQPRGGYWGYWCVGRQGLYLLDTDPPAPRIVNYDFSTRRTSMVATLDHLPPLYSGLTIDRNEHELLMTDEHSVGSHLSLVENMQ